MINDQPAAEVTQSQTSGTTDTSSQTSNAPQQPSYWPGDWRERMAGGDEKMLKHLGRFNDPTDIYAKWRYLDEHRNAPRDPIEPELYRKSLPQELNDVIADDETVGFIFDTLAKHGVPADVAKDVFSEYVQVLGKQDDAAQLQQEMQRVEAEETLRNSWKGPEYQRNINAVQTLFAMFGDEKALDAINESGLGNNPEFIHLMAKIANEVNPTVSMTATPGMNAKTSIDDEISQIEAQMSGDARSDYWSNQGMQARYRELISIRERRS